MATTKQAVRSRRAAPKAVPAPRESAQDYHTFALVLQGGGALGAYQCGVYEAMHDAGLRPNWFVGTSIGAINAAILAGNAPQDRVARLHEFWDMVCEPMGSATWIGAGVRQLLAWNPDNLMLDAWANSLGALGAMAVGQRGFFRPRYQVPFLYKDGSPEATSFYDTSMLRRSLERLVDFDRINAKSGGVRLSVVAADVETGNSHAFDSRRERIRPEHIMASGALPPSFPSMEIDGRHYWDGGIVTNTPLDLVWDDSPRADTLVVQVDLWSARGRLPRDMMDVLERTKDIQFSSRTRAETDSGIKLQKLRLALEELLEKIPAGTLDEQTLQTLEPWACSHVYNIVHLIYQTKPTETQFKDYAFGIGTQREHWASGVQDMRDTLARPRFFVKPSREEGVVTHDVHRRLRTPEPD